MKKNHITISEYIEYVLKEINSSSEKWGYEPAEEIKCELNILEVNKNGRNISALITRNKSDKTAAISKLAFKLKPLQKPTEININLGRDQDLPTQKIVKK